MSSSRFVTQRGRRILVIGLLVCLTLPASAVAQAPVDILPNLVADAPSAPTIQEEFDVERGSGVDLRRLLRFDGFVHNAGQGPLEMHGTGPASLAMGSVFQRIKQSDGTWRDRTPPPGTEILYESADGHSHWHLKQIARYSLWNQADTAEVAPAMKAGFCLLDTRPVDGHAGSSYYGDSDGVPWTNCERLETEAPSVTMGVSGGWRDVYDSSLWFQWVDISNVAPGPYRLRSEIDPEGEILETQEANLPTSTDVVVSGYVAEPGAVEALSTAPTTFDLTAHAYAAAGETLAAPRYRVDVLPSHGTLLDASGDPVTSGTWLPDPAVTFVPDSSLASPVMDDLEFTAREAVGTGVSRYPTSPPSATITVDIGNSQSEYLAISGAQDLVAGTSRQLNASVQAGSPSQLTWSATAGSVSASGLYVAPGQVPPGGSVTVRAALPSGVDDEVTFRILAKPPVKPAPTTDTPAVLPATPESVLPPASPGPTPDGVVKPTPKLELLARRNGRRVSASIVSRYTGRLTLSLMRGKRRVSRCTLQVRAKRSYVCQLPLRGATGHLRVVATLRRANGRLVTRAVKVQTPHRH